jgi:hypothetical protein
MPITWKKGKRFKPAVLLERIASIRTVSPEGSVSFSGFELEDCLPAIRSMLNFPDAAIDIDTANLVWLGIARVKNELTMQNFLTAINSELSAKLAGKEQVYFLLTSLSIDHRDVPKKLQLLGAELTFMANNYPMRFKSRSILLQSQTVPVEPEPNTYCRVVVKVKAKTANAAVNCALRALDLQRAIWCLMGNPRMQTLYGNSLPKPINVVRLGSRHTLHHETGEPADEGLWYEPGYSKTEIFRIKKPDLYKKRTFFARRSLSMSKYGEKIISSLLKYVRALDEAESNTAYLRLWGALETLVTPGIADYDRLVSRCAFLFQDMEFHQQLLEHLREYRNASVHAGEESERARTYCFQLQLYFIHLIWFHLSNANFFTSLLEANIFLDLPPAKLDLQRSLKLTKKALKFVG